MLKTKKSDKNDSVCKPSAESCDFCPTKNDSVLCSHPEALKMIDDAKVTCRYSKDQVIFQEGSLPLGLFSIQSGLVKLEVNSENGSSHTVRMHGPGDMLGYRSLFANEKYHANAIAVEDSVLCYIPKNDILRVCSAYPQVGLNIMEHLSKDLRLAEEKWVDQMDKAAVARIAEAVLFLNDHFEHENWTRREIAQWAGTTPETVMRTLGQFEKDGLLLQKGRGIELTDRQRLDEISKTTVR